MRFVIPGDQGGELHTGLGLAPAWNRDHLHRIEIVLAVNPVLGSG